MIRQPPKYLSEIKNTGWISELIEEHFGNILTLMHPEVVIYGGAVRDAVANKPFKGDIDFIVPKNRLKTMTKTFLLNPLWGIDTSDKGVVANPINVEHIKNAYGNLHHVGNPISNIKYFKNYEGKKIQLMVPKELHNNWLNCVTSLARTVDIVCCSLILLHDGRVFETLPDAYKQCKENLLVANEYTNVAYAHKLKKRVEKLSGRGWVNTINVEKVMKNNRKRRKKLEIHQKIEGSKKAKTTSLMSSKPTKIERTPEKWTHEWHVEETGTIKKRLSPKKGKLKDYRTYVLPHKVIDHYTTDHLSASTCATNLSASTHATDSETFIYTVSSTTST